MVRPPGVRAEVGLPLSDAPGGRPALDTLHPGERPELPVAPVLGPGQRPRHVTLKVGQFVVCTAEIKELSLLIHRTIINTCRSNKFKKTQTPVSNIIFLFYSKLWFLKFNCVSFRDGIVMMDSMNVGGGGERSADQSLGRKKKRGVDSH